jgi:hypothetical protein
MVTHACNPNYSGSGSWATMSSKPAKEVLERFYFKNKTYDNKREGGMTQVEEHLSSMFKVMGKTTSYKKLSLFQNSYT